MRAKDIKGKKFHIEGVDATGSLVLAECTDREERAIVRLDKAKSGEPLKMGQEMCQLRPDDSGHFEVNGLLDDVDLESSGGGPAMVTSDEYRDGWERTFGSKGVN